VQIEQRAGRWSLLGRLRGWHFNHRRRRRFRCAE
jgi:dTDP-4-dehydrorhamnose 3,5-epimerase-like enzyme